MTARRKKMEMIQTNRLILRPLQSADSATLVQEFSNYNIVRNTARIPFPYSLSDAEEHLVFVSSLNAQSKSLALTRNENPSQLIGGISYLFSPEKKDAELGYWLSEQHWGQGLMTEAVNAMLADGASLGIKKFVACYHAGNLVSAKILKRHGFIEKGTCRNFSKAQGREVDVVNMVLEV
jgi:RimJ/RimL family protein N-acetyltransferase